MSSDLYSSPWSKSASYHDSKKKEEEKGAGISGGDVDADGKPLAVGLSLVGGWVGVPARGLLRA